MQATFHGINEAFVSAVGIFQMASDPTASVRASARMMPIGRSNSRLGPTLFVDEPVLVNYTSPLDRVLMNGARDANPFFMLYEALWMLAGRNDVKALSHYNTKLAGLASDDGETYNGAYGYRWRKTWADKGDAESSSRIDPRTQVDQLDIIVDHLKANPYSRRAVLQMWNVEDDLLKIGRHCNTCRGDGCHPMSNHPRNAERIKEAPCPECKGTCKGSRDVCCNTEVMFSIKDHEQTGFVLDMTVVNRSNDLVLGMLGGDFVCFSFLMEYVAARLSPGMRIGTYSHFTNNLHVYLDNFKPEAWLADTDRVDYVSANPTSAEPKLVNDAERFESELPRFVEHYARFDELLTLTECWQEPFFRDVAAPMLLAFRMRKMGGPMGYTNALNHTRLIKSPQWRYVAQGWLLRRLNKMNKKESVQ